ncbi:hypothetical protein T492DRAFT_833579 [Pavlovales sp. CCMP2436]|nr:hypothetical protein T492DRAFT_833579 [Pavlovales sp. CCMP2436]
MGRPVENREWVARSKIRNGSPGLRRRVELQDKNQRCYQDIGRRMEVIVDRNTQVGRTLANANVSGKRVSGIYVIWPGWSKVPFVKLGLTTNIYSRAMNGYSHYMPYSEPGRSFDLVGYLVVAPSLVSTRETRVLNLASKQNGWETPPRDKEWRRWLEAPGDVHMAIAQLLAALRTTVNGLWYTFERGTEKY